MDTIERTFLLFVSNVHIQFGIIPKWMSKISLYSAIIAIAFTGLMIIPISFGVTSVYAQQQFSTGPDDQRPPNGRPPYPVPFGQPPFAQASNFSFGPVASIQNNESGQPAWVVVGFWRGNLLSFNETTVTPAQNGDGNGSSLTSPSIFNADFRMIMLNGSGAHTHVITNFILSNVSSNENGTITYTGNSTVSMPEAPLVDVSTTINVSGEIISIIPDPSKVNQHFGNTPIYGAIEPEEEGLRGLPPGPPPSP